MKAIINAKAVLPAGVIENCTILIDGEKITAVGQDINLPAGTEV